MRRFEIVKRIKDIADVKKPHRSTKTSAGYDFYAIEDTKIPALALLQPVLVKTGIKAQMNDDEFLMLANRSSNPKKGLILANGIGVIDSDYYGNPENDGEIMFAFLNFRSEPITIHKGDKIGQGIFQKYLTTDDDNANGERIGGFGSTGR